MAYMGVHSSQSSRVDHRRDIRETGNSVPIIAMTANAMPEDIKRARESGMDDHISKPLDLPKMMETIARVLQ